MPKTKGLGKGLDALIGDTSLQAQSEGTIQLPITQVEPCENQPRKQFDDNSLNDLADSIRENGIIQPISVRRLSSGYYQIIAGERRWRAAKLANLKEIPAVIIEADDRKAMELSLIENLQRDDLTPIEEAQGYQQLISNYSMTQEELSEKIGKSRSSIANTLRLTSLPEEIQELISEKKLSAGHGRAILTVSGGEETQIAFAKLILKQDLSVRQAEARAKKFTMGTYEIEPKKEDENKIYIKEIENDLSNRFGRKVSINAGKKKGHLDLEFYDEEDLNSLIEQLNALENKGAV